MATKASIHRAVRNRNELLWLLLRHPRLAAELQVANLKLDAAGRLLAIPKMGCPFQGNAPCPVQLVEQPNLVLGGPADHRVAVGNPMRRPPGGSSRKAPIKPKITPGR